MDNPIRFEPRYFTATFPYIVNSISRIYYATTEINAETAGQNYPGNPNTKFIWYEISTANSSNSHLTTAITGFIQAPYFTYFTYSYLLVLANNPFVGTYLTISELVFSPGVSSLSANFPSVYQAGDSVSFGAMIKDMKKVYRKNEQQAA